MKLVDSTFHAHVPIYPSQEIKKKVKVEMVKSLLIVPIILLPIFT